MKRRNKFINPNDFGIFKVIFLLSLIFLMAMKQPSYGYDLNTQKNILVLNSYNEDMDWTRGLTEGITNSVRQADRNIFISFEYMDWKNYPTQVNLQYLYSYYKLKYENRHFDVIIACDDIAFQFALEHRKELFSDAPIVFCGVNQVSLDKIGRSYSNYTGVIEVADPTKTIQMAYDINPSIDKIYLVCDNTESGITTAKMFTDKITELKTGAELIPLNQLDFDELLKKLQGLDNRSIVLYATYNMDASGNIFEYNIALKEICKNSAVPVYHQYYFGLQDGVFGGNLISPKVYGAEAADRAIRIINGEEADQIGIFTSDAAIKTIDYSQLNRFEISPNKIPKGVRLVNKPFSFFETYRSLVFIVLTAFISLLIILAVLLVYTNTVSKMKQKLAVKNKELTDLYKELYSSDEELKSQYEEIFSIQEDLQKSEEKYNYLAMHDPLTGLPNRRSLFIDGQRMLQDSEYSALLFLDLDNFKYINDSLGHVMGDELIKKVSERLSTVLIENSILYRLGGDEFIVMLYQLDHVDTVECFVNTLLTKLKHEFEVLSSTLMVSASIGVSLYPTHGRDMEELIKLADIAMYQAKENGRNHFVFYENEMNQDFTERMILEKHLYSAIKDNEMEVYYQPQIDLENNRVTGLEALLRWTSHELGPISPYRFIEVAESNRFIIPLGDWVLSQACGFIRELHDSGYDGMKISVNISIIQIMQADFVDKVRKTLELYQLEPDCLELEVTETVLIKSLDVVFHKLKQLDEMGIGIALDDFGKGYSSLNYLRQLPIKVLKIDKSFIDHITVVCEQKEITKHIIHMGKALGMTIIAEGVETQDQMMHLRKYQCDTIQGYYYSKPLPRLALKKFIQGYNANNQAVSE